MQNSQKSKDEDTFLVKTSSVDEYGFCDQVVLFFKRNPHQVPYPQQPDQVGLHCAKAIRDIHKAVNKVEQEREDGDLQIREFKIRYKEKPVDYYAFKISLPQKAKKDQKLVVDLVHEFDQVDEEEEMQYDMVNVKPLKASGLTNNLYQDHVKNPDGQKVKSKKIINLNGIQTDLVHLHQDYREKLNYSRKLLVKAMDLSLNESQKDTATLGIFETFIEIVAQFPEKEMQETLTQCLTIKESMEQESLVKEAVEQIANTRKGISDYTSYKVMEELEEFKRFSEFGPVKHIQRALKGGEKELNNKTSDELLYYNLHLSLNNS